MQEPTDNGINPKDDAEKILRDSGTKEHSKRNHKKILAGIGLLCATVIVFLILGEILARIVFGSVLLKEHEPNGYFYLKPNQEGWYPPSEWQGARINNIGARGGDVDVDYLKENTKYVFLGDSATFGWLLKDTQTIPYNFQKKMGLSDDKVLNLGEGGYGIDHMRVKYERNKEYYVDGDVVFLILIDNDFGRPFIPPRTGFKGFLWNVKRHSSFLSFVYDQTGTIQYAIKDKLGTQAKDKSYFSEEAFDKVIEFDEEVKGNNQKLIVVLHEFNRTNFTDQGLEFCSKNKITCTTTYDSIARVMPVEDRFASDGGHPSEHSDREIGIGLANFINREKLSIK